MLYFLDTEFIEGFYRPFLGKRRHFLELISIGIVAEDGREYYAISNEFTRRLASEWVKDNVLAKLPYRWSIQESNCVADMNSGMFVPPVEHPLYKSNRQIAKEIIAFIYPNALYNHPDQLPSQIGDPGCENPEFYAYCGACDWILFYSLFGRLVDRPKGFPVYYNDLKQMSDAREKLIKSCRPDNLLVERLRAEGDPLMIERGRMKDFYDYPKQDDEHNALDDAKWNMALYQFLQNV